MEEFDFTGRRLVDAAIRRFLTRIRTWLDGDRPMARTGPDQTPQANDRKTRLAEELRANLARRKAQARSRKAGNEGETDFERGDAISKGLDEE